MDTALQKRAHAAPDDEGRRIAVSFWDGYKDEGGGKYLSAAEKAALIENAVVLEITGVRFDEKNQFKGNAAPRFVVTFMVPNPLTGENEERLAGFATIPDGSSRDRLLEALIDYLEDPDETDPILVVLELVGNFVLIRKAD